MIEIDGFYVADKVVTVGECIYELEEHFNKNYMPTILDGYISPIHHLEFNDDAGFGRVVYMIVDDTEPDVHIDTVEELISELDKFEEDCFLFAHGSGLVRTSIDCITDYIFDVNGLGEEILIPFNVSFMTTSHCMCPF